MTEARKKRQNFQYLILALMEKNIVKRFFSALFSNSGNFGFFEYLFFYWKIFSRFFSRTYILKRNKIYTVKLFPWLHNYETIWNPWNGKLKATLYQIRIWNLTLSQKLYYLSINCIQTNRGIDESSTTQLKQMRINFVANAYNFYWHIIKVSCLLKQYLEINQSSRRMININ